MHGWHAAAIAPSWLITSAGRTPRAALQRSIPRDTSPPPLPGHPTMV